MAAVAHDQVYAITKTDVPSAGLEGTYAEKDLGRGSIDHTASNSADSLEEEHKITDEDLQLRRVSGKIAWQSYSVSFCEAAERFSYYGSTVVFVNFIQQPLPPGSRTGAGGTDGQSGALGMGQRASTGLVTFNQFWAYVMPLFGAYLADARFGRYKTIQMAIGCAIVGHLILVASAAPSVLANPHTSIGVFALGLIILGVGTGGFKSNISPLLAEQQTDTVMHVKTLKSGERVLVDPAVTVSRLFLYFYLCINVGSLTGQISMVYAEKYVGFWLSYLLPTVLFFAAPIVLMVCKKHYKLTPPTGNVFAKFWQLYFFALKGRWSINPVKLYRNMSDPALWERAKPSNIPVADRPVWMTFDDAWVDEVRRGLKACSVFVWYPIYWLAYGQMTGNLTSQAATMVLNGVPNDIIQNLNPISIIIMIPIMDFVIYPALRKAKLNPTPIKRITAGFFFGSASMVAACVTQFYIYKLGPCGNDASNCDEPAPINVWVQTIPYVLIGFSEISASITGLEYACTKAPKNMRSLVMGVFLLANAFSSAIAQGWTALATDPLLVWNYGSIAVLSFVAGVGFWFTFRDLDRDDDRLNMLKESTYAGRKQSVAIEEGEVDVQREKN